MFVVPDAFFDFNDTVEANKNSEIYFVGIHPTNTALLFEVAIVPCDVDVQTIL